MKINDFDNKVLAGLDFNPVGCKELATKLGLDRTGVYRSLYKLMKAGLAVNEKYADPTDKSDFYAAPGRYTRKMV